MTGEMKLEVIVPINDNTTFPVKILTENKAKEMVLKALRDVSAEIEKVYKQEEPIDHTWAMGLRHSLKIINKYTAESEAKK